MLSKKFIFQTNKTDYNKIGQYIRDWALLRLRQKQLKTITFDTWNCFNPSPPPFTHLSISPHNNHNLHKPTCGVQETGLKPVLFTIDKFENNSKGAPCSNYSLNYLVQKFKLFLWVHLPSLAKCLGCCIFWPAFICNVFCATKLKKGKRVRNLRQNLTKKHFF